MCMPTRERQGDTITRTLVDTVYITDTVTVCHPVPYIVTRIDTLRITDTIMIREQKTYKDSLYTAWVSGYNPVLDSIKLYPRTTLIREDIIRRIYVPSKSKPFGLGLQAGYGYPGGAYVGIGISYNLLNW